MGPSAPFWRLGAITVVTPLNEGSTLPTVSAVPLGSNSGNLTIRRASDSDTV